MQGPCVTTETLHANDRIKRHTFDHFVQFDTMFLQNRLVLPLVDTATHFCSAAFLQPQSRRDIWKFILNQLVLIYVGTPDYLSLDQKSTFASKEIRENVEAARITLKEAPIETPGSIGTVERYQAPLRSVYDKIRRDLAHGFSDKECLEISMFPNSSTMDP